ncbi:hypothetical protein TEA_008085 [Camellia sinensis var. sinensis]|uniref:Uncharacterized protein n=1 Tax=Camellia sinensis var. sinensis TaxID=542762 RepID=A0A4S4D4W1_CAMSN|nr:hypothetical protein TEA_008085 [Camellia sinensis var. sinensis]
MDIEISGKGVDGYRDFRKGFSYNGEICRYSYPYMISRALFADAAKVANGEVSKAGPLIEYERRIEAGDLVDGDNCQVLQSIHSSCLIISFKGKASSLYVSSEFSPAQKVTFLIFDRNFPWPLLLVGNLPFVANNSLFWPAIHLCVRQCWQPGFCLDLGVVRSCFVSFGFRKCV